MSLLSFNSNLASLRAQRRLQDSTVVLRKMFERLSSGLRINRASDDAAGLSISANLNTDARVYSQGIRNVNDGISALNVADGALSELSNVVVRLNELATQAANGTLGRTQRLALDAEATALTEEYNRIISTSRFNGLGLLDGTFGSLSIQSGYGSRESTVLGIGQGLGRNVGDGTYSLDQTVADGTTIVATGDLDNDGDIDVVSAVGNGTAYVYQNDGSGNLTQIDTIAAGTNRFDVALADYNNDGFLDIITNTSNNVRVYANNGSGQFPVGGSPSVNLVTGALLVTGIKTGDFNNDGFVDILAAGSSFDNTWEVWTGNGSTFTRTTQYIGGQQGLNPEEFTVGDINGDGNLDVLQLDGSAVGIHYGNGNGTFASPVSVAATGAFDNGSIALMDVNRDGLKDVLYGGIGTGIRALVQQSNGTFVEEVIGGQSGGSFNAIRVGDINGDGNDDIYSSTTVDSGVKFVNNADGTFTASFGDDEITGFVDFAFADLDGDGALDIVGNEATSSAGTQVFLANTEESTTIERINLTTQQTARASLDTIEAIMSRIIAERGAIGSTLSRLQTVINNLEQRRESYLDAASRITDSDVATDAAELTRSSIVQQAAQAVLAQANLSTDIGLFLLQR